ncbi:MAG: FkbM family methyltransferase [Coleofasciculaceae cyanobacterium]
METSGTTADCYWQYLKSACLNLDSDLSSHIAAILESTSWDNPTSALDLNNCAVVALVEAENCQDFSLRGMYLEMAFDALSQGVELYSHPLCASHLALVLAMTGESDRAIQIASHSLINSLAPAHVEERAISSGLVYVAPITGLSNSRDEKLAQILHSKNGYSQALLLLSEVLCRSLLVFYNSSGLRFLHLAAQLSPQSAAINLKLGISSLVNHQLEGLLYLNRARQIAPDSATILQALYIAYRDMGQKETASFWMSMGRDFSPNNSRSLDWRWTDLDVDSLISYVPFENYLLLAVEPSFRSIVTSVLIAEGDWFEKEMEFWRNWIKPGMTVIDVGANVGVYAFSAAQRVGVDGCVLAIEPFSGCVRSLQETCRVNDLSWVKVCAGAASDRNGRVRLALYGASELNEIISSEAEATVRQGNFEEVPCFTLDSLIEQENVSQVDLLKIDAEGHELQVLGGSERILREFNPVILYENIAGSKGSNSVVADFLKSKGYQLFRYQPYLEQLIPIASSEDLQGRLNIIAVPQDKNSAVSA